MLDVDNLGIGTSDIFVFIFKSGRRLVESGQKIIFKRKEATTFIRTLCETFLSSEKWKKKTKLACFTEKEKMSLHWKTDV